MHSRCGLAILEAPELHHGNYHTNGGGRGLEDSESQRIHHAEQTPHKGSRIESTPEDQLVLELQIEIYIRIIAFSLTFEFIVPPLISFVVDEEPPAHLDELAADDVLHYPEVDACKHHHHDVHEDLREHNRHKEITKGKS